MQQHQRGKLIICYCCSVALGTFNHAKCNVCQWAKHHMLTSITIASTEQGHGHFSHFSLDSGSVWNIAGSDGTSGSSHSELLGEELQATDCTPPTSQPGSQPLSPCPAVCRLMPHSAWNQIMGAHRMIGKKVLYSLTPLLKWQVCFVAGYSIEPHLL